MHETFSELLSGYSVGEIASVWDSVPVCSGLSTANLHKLNRDIRVILFVDQPNRDKQISLLLESGEWELWKEIHNDIYGSIIVGLIRR